MAKRWAQMAMPSLVSKSVQDTAYSKIDITSPEFVIGRALKSSFIIPELSLSRQQCIIRYADEQWSVTDESSAGTYINGVKMTKGSTVKLKADDTIQFGCTNKWIYTFCFLEHHHTSEDPKVKRVKLDLEKSPISGKLQELHSQLTAKSDNIEKALKQLNESEAAIRLSGQIRENQELQVQIVREKENIQKLFEDDMKIIEQRLRNGGTTGTGVQSDRDTEKINVEKWELKQKLDETLAGLEEKLNRAINNELSIKREKEEIENRIRKDREEFENRILKEQEELKLQLAQVQKLTEKLHNERAKAQAALLERDQQLQHLQKLSNKESQVLKKRLKSLKSRLVEKEKKEEENRHNLLEVAKHAQMLEEERENQVHHNQSLMDRLLSDMNEIEEAAKLRLRRSLDNLNQDKINIENQIKEKSESKEDVGKLTEELDKVKQKLVIIDQKREMLEKELNEAVQSASTNTLQAREEVLHNFGELMETELQCSICNELFVAATTLTCNHTFCKFCINEWKKKKKDCPVCRKPITAEFRSISLDNFINKMVENLSDDMKKKRQELKEEREALDNKTKKQTTNQTAAGRRGNTRRTAQRTRTQNNPRQRQRVRTQSPQPSSSSSSIDIITLEIPLSSDSDSSDSSESDFSSDSSFAEGVEGHFYGGYGSCFHCGRSGHWANGCPDLF